MFIMKSFDILIKGFFVFYNQTITFFFSLSEWSIVRYMLYTCHIKNKKKLFICYLLISFHTIMVELLILHYNFTNCKTVKRVLFCFGNLKFGPDKL